MDGFDCDVEAGPKVESFVQVAVQGERGDRWIYRSYNVLVLVRLSLFINFSPLEKNLFIHTHAPRGQVVRAGKA